MGFSSSVSDYDDHDQDLPIVERDPLGRYVRHDEILGEGASKTVFRAFDEEKGIEVAWAKVDISEDTLKSKKQLESLNSEADLLKSLKHENIVRCYHSWVDDKTKTFNMITELVTSGNLRDYRCKHKGLTDNKAIKKWGKQILLGLNYLHSQNPPILHRDLKSENIFVNGNNGKVKIGDLGLATVLRHARAHSCIGTPEFMAPELYDEEYDQLVDIYSFGMCMLQMVTCELPYSECKNPAQVFKKVTSGVRPLALDKVVDPQVRGFIDKCIAPVSERWSASDLLNDPFLKDGSTPVSRTPSLNESVCTILSCPSSLNESVCTNISSPPSLNESVCTNVSIPPSVNESLCTVISSPPSLDESVCTNVSSKPEKIDKFKLEGKMKEKNVIWMSLGYTNSVGVGEKAEFMFSLDNDTVSQVVDEMIKDLKLLTEDAGLISELMERVITQLVPVFTPSLDKSVDFSQKFNLSSGNQNPNSLVMMESVQECHSGAGMMGAQANVFDHLSGRKGRRRCVRCLEKLLFRCWKPVCVV